MSQTFEHQLDLTLDMRRQRRLQRQAEQAQTERAIEDAHVELERRQTRFHKEVRPLIQKAVERANRHLTKRPDKCQLCEVSGYYTGPLYIGGSVCNPIAYGLQTDKQQTGEAMIVELTHDGMIDAFLGPFHPSVPGGNTTRIDFGWHPIPLDEFSAENALNLVLRYIAAVTGDWPLHRECTAEMMRRS